MRTNWVIGLFATGLIAGCGMSSRDGQETQLTTAVQQPPPRAAVQDAVRIAGYLENYSVVKKDNAITVTNRVDGSSTSYPAATQTIKFVDQHVSFDIEGSPGKIYRLYQAAFNRKPDPSGLGFWIKAAQSGVPMQTIAENFLGSNEFATLYGANTSAEDFVGALYNNILHRAPDQGGYDWWVKTVKNGIARADVLISFAASDENRLAVDPSIAGGFAYDYLRGAGDAILPKPTSYANAKDNALAQIAFPAASVGVAGDGPLAWGAGDFEQTGQLGFFTATQNYRQWELTYEQATASNATYADFAFWKYGNDGQLLQVSSVKGCLHPRKGVVADFNRDGIPDVFVACTGYDAGTFPGERSKLLLSDGRGGFNMTDVLDVGYYHGAAAADVNKDGYPDLVVADNKKNPNVYFLINQKDGTFKIDTSRIDGVQDLSPYFSVELVDVNGDGIVDLLAGGHEQSGTAPTKVLYGDAQGRFGANGNAAVLPAVPGRGVVLDFTVVKTGTTVGFFINRSGDETSKEGFYGTRTVQWVNMATMESKLLLDQKGQWVPWWLPVKRNDVAGVVPYYNRASYFLPQ